MTKKTLSVAGLLTALSLAVPLIAGADLNYPTVVGNIDTVVGGGNGDGGPAISAILDPRGLVTCGPHNDLYIANGSYNQVRKIDGDTGETSTVAGTGIGGYSGNGGQAKNAQLKFPTEVVCDANGNLYVADTENNVVRKINTNGIISTFAGNGSAGSAGDGGPATQANLWAPRGLATDPQGNLYIAEFSGNRIRKVTPDGVITRIAGKVDATWGSTGDNGPATAATLANPSGIAVDSAGRIFIADYNNSKIRRIGTDGTINTIAGDGYQGFSGDGGSAQASRLKQPYRLRFDPNGNLVFLDGGNTRVRRLQAVNGVVGSNSGITTIAGNGTNGSTGDGGPALNATFWYMNGLAVDPTGKVYVGATVNTIPSLDNRVRVINTNGVVTAFAGSGNGDGGPAINALIDPRGIETGTGASANGLYIADANNNRIRFVDGDTGIITTIAGSGVTCQTTTAPCGDNGPALNAQLKSPFDVARDAAGNLYIADTLNNRIRRVTPSGTITTVAGAGNYALGGDGGDATRAFLAMPYGVAVNSTGTLLYIADFANYRIRKVENGIITTYAGSGFGNSGDNGPATAARFASPADVAIGPDGMVYIADYDNNLIRRVRANGIIERVAGDGTACTTSTAPCGDGGSALNAKLYQPFRLVFASGALYVADSSTKRIRRVDLSTGTITTVAGTGIAGTEGDKGPAIAANLYRGTGLAIEGNHLFIAQSDISRVRAVTLPVGSPPPPSYTLNVSKGGTGTGTVTGNGINCGSDCSALLASGTVVTLTPTPAAGSTFTGWTGDSGCGGQLSMTANKTCIATFTLVPLPTVNIKANGSEAPNQIAYGTAAMLSWDSTNATTCTVTSADANDLTGTSNVGISTGPLTASKTYFITCSGPGSGMAIDSVTVSVAPAQYTLSVSKAGTGSGTVAGTDISCGSDCSDSYVSGTTVTLTATPTSGSTFAGWSGDVGCGGQVTMNANKSCVATFSSIPAPTADLKINGSHAPDPVAYGAAVILSWRSTNATTCTVTPGNLNGLFNDGVTTGPLTESKTYILSCTGAGGGRTDDQVLIPVADQPPAAGTVTGRVTYYPSGAGISNVNVQLSQSGAAASTTQTDNSGSFSFTGVTAGDWTATYQKTATSGDYNSITSLDASYALEAAVGLKSPSDLQRKACDTNKSNSLTAIDAVPILAYRAHLITYLPASNQGVDTWNFETATQLFSLSAGGTQTLQIKASFLGDCNGSWSGS